MFKNAATKLAHNTTLSAIGGNKDLKPLQDLITAEKSVLSSLQKLSLDLSKASEALRLWGGGEGDDLGDTLSASTALLVQFANALAQYASHEQGIREQMKSIRTKEEALDELKRRRKSVGAKADAAEKRLSKMSSEHKSLQMQTDTLNRLRDEMRALDTEIMSDEARLSDFKRTATRAFMGLKFGGLQELCGKGNIVGDFGMQIISEVPEEITQPGLPRAFYGGHGKTEWCVIEAQRHIGEVPFSGAPGPSDLASTVDNHYTPMPNHGAHLMRQPSGYTSNDTSMPSSPYPASQTFSPNQSYVAPWNNQNQPQGMDDFGVLPATSSSMGPNSSSRFGNGPTSAASGGRFATFPVKSRDAPPSIGIESRNDSLDFSSQIEQALRTSPSNSSFANSNANTNGFASGYTGLPVVEESLPIYEPYGAANSSSSFSTPSASVYAQQPQSPMRAQNPQGNPWNDAGTSAGRADNNHLLPNPDIKHHDDGDSRDDLRLAYMSSREDLGQDSSVGGSHTRYAAGSASDLGERRSDDAGSRNVESPIQEQGEGGYGGEPTPREEVGEPLPLPPSNVPTNTELYQPPAAPRIRVPSFEGDEEAAANAAAAREVSREMDALTFNPPPPPPPLLNQGIPPAPLSIPPVAPLEVPPKDNPPPPRTPVTSTTSTDGSPPGRYNLPNKALGNRTPSSTSLGSNGSNSYGRTASPSESTYRPLLTTSQLSNMGANKGSMSSTSLTSPGLPGTPRTISAAAFKRSPRMASAENNIVAPAAIADISPLSFKKRPSVGAGSALPSSPNPNRLQSLSTSRGGSSAPPPSSFSGAVPSSPVDGSHRRVPSSVPQNTFPDEDDQFDYITAYVNNVPGAEELGQPPPRSASGGYGVGRFATNLESDGSLR